MAGLSPGPAPEGLLARLRQKRGLSRLALGWEWLWPRLFPVLGVAGGFLILALLELPQRLPWWLHGLLLLGFAAGLGWLAWRQFRAFRWPDAAAADRRMERGSGLDHRPLQALQDRPAGNDPVAQAVWRVHQARAAAVLATLKVPPPSPGLPARDPRAARAALVLGLAAAFGIAGGDAPQRVATALVPQLPGPALPPALRIEAWVTPPAYTGAPPIFLDTAGGAVRVPIGSKLQLALSGGQGAAPELVVPHGPGGFRQLDASSWTAEAELTEDGALAVRRNGQDVVRWALTVQPDAPPTVAFAEPPARGQRGLGLRMPWRAEDDWGVAALRAEARLKVRPEAPPLVIEMPLPGGNPRQLKGTATPDLSAHPWAGLEVEFRLVARDCAGQTGTSDGAVIALPERSFNHPVAKQVIAVRRALSVDPLARREARLALETIARAPEAFEHDTTTYLALRVARSRLVADRRPEAVEEVQALLWEVALALEEGREGRTQRALQQAQEAVRQAIENAERNPQDQQARQEVERRIQELRDAIRQHLEALAGRLQRENAEALPFDPQQRMMNQRDIDRRTERMRDAAREGRTEEAKREMAELEEMLKALQEGRMSRAEQEQRQQRRERGQQQMGVVQDMVKRQSEMLDRGHQRAEGDERQRAEERRRQQRERQQGLRWPPEPRQDPQQAQQGAAQEQQQAERTQDARRQRALRRALGELMQQFGDMTGQVPEALGRADQAMRDAQEALGEGRDAREAQQRAMRALQEGGRQMAQQMQRQFGMSMDGEEDGDPQDQAGDPQQGGEGQDQGRQLGDGRDPLGRRNRDVNGNADNGADTRVPEEAELLRTRRIQDELRRRSADKERPADELDYIDRLLKRF